jgi:hypothetical protein
MARQPSAKRTLKAGDKGPVLIYMRSMIIASAAFNFWFYGYPTQLADDGMRSI